jgi:hypothetical protein
MAIGAVTNAQQSISAFSEVSNICTAMGLVIANTYTLYSLNSVLAAGLLSSHVLHISTESKNAVVHATPYSQSISLWPQCLSSGMGLTGQAEGHHSLNYMLGTLIGYTSTTYTCIH